MPLETRKVLLGHKNSDITTHYSAPEMEELIEAANKVCAVNASAGDAEAKNGYQNNPITDKYYS